MAKKQVIWSRSAKKDLYTALESHLKEYGDKKLTSLFFSAAQRKIQLLRRGRIQAGKTSLKNICFFTEENWQFLFEEQETSLIIHNVSECSPEMIVENF